MYARDDHHVGVLGRSRENGQGDQQEQVVQHRVRSFSVELTLVVNYIITQTPNLFEEVQWKIHDPHPSSAVVKFIV